MTVDLRTQYLGLTLANPIVAAACPLTRSLDSLKRLADAGVGAAVFPSLFEEQIEAEELELHRLYEQGTDSFSESTTWFPELPNYDVGPDDYLRRIEDAKKAVPIPIIGSLNGSSPGGWVRYAKLIEEAGADALELNTYFLPADITLTAEAVERRQVELVTSVRAAVSIPLAVKVPPFFSSFGHLARQLVAAGADGLVLFNRFVHPDIDLETLTVRPHLELSHSYEARLPLTWIAILRGRIEASLAATSGVHTATDALKLLLVGADATMVVSALYKNGTDHVRTLVGGIQRWLEERDYTSVEQMKGSFSQQHSPDPTAFERAGYMKTLGTFTSDLP